MSPAMGPADPVFFAGPAELRAWFEANHETATELWVGLHKKGSGRPSVTWPELVDEALCFGWIDGVRRSIDESSYMNRVTPRTARSNWSAVNIKRVAELTEQGRMRPAGLRAFQRRRPDAEILGAYSYEQRHTAGLGAEYEARLRSNEAAWAYFQGRSPSYRRSAAHWVTSAKREETRTRRLEQLIADSALGRPVPPLDRGP